MKKALITGINGFVGPYLRKELEANGYRVYGLDLHGTEGAYACDITSFEQVFKVVDAVKPDFIFHLAGFSSVAKSFENPLLCFKINVEGTKNLLDAIVKVGLKPKILIVSSAEVYGVPKYLPIDEKHPLDPISPYGKSRVEQEKLALGYDLHVVISRSFNHTGPGQPTTFVIPSFKKQVDEAKDGDTIYVGNLDVVRDFSDVRDVVKAYRILLEKGKAKEIYNVGSGIGYRLRDILESLIKKSGKRLMVEIDPDKLRKNDIFKVVSDNKKINDLAVKLERMLF